MKNIISIHAGVTCIYIDTLCSSLKYKIIIERIKLISLKNILTFFLSGTISILLKGGGKRGGTNFQFWFRIYYATAVSRPCVWRVYRKTFDIKS